MNDFEQRVRQAFDQVEVPADVKRQTLSFIEEARCASVASVAQKPEPVSSRSPKPRASFHAVRFRRIAALAACFVLVVTCLGGFRLYAQPTAYVGIDINPSIELSVNRFGIVVGSEALNEDGAALLDSVSLTNRSYADALAALTGSDAFAPYAQENSFVEVSVTSDNQRQVESLCAQSDATLSALPCQGACAVVDAQTRDAAFAAGMGVGRYNAALELIELDPSVTLEECAGMSMRELRDRIASYRGDASTPSGAGRGAQGGRGAGGAGHGAGRGAGWSAGS